MDSSNTSFTMDNSNTSSNNNKMNTSPIDSNDILFDGSNEKQCKESFMKYYKLTEIQFNAVFHGILKKTYSRTIFITDGDNLYTQIGPNKKRIELLISPHLNAHINEIKKMDNPLHYLQRDRDNYEQFIADSMFTILSKLQDKADDQENQIGELKKDQQNENSENNIDIIDHKSKLVKLEKWCNEIAEDHNILYLIDMINKEYYYFSDNLTTEIHDPRMLKSDLNIFKRHFINGNKKCDLIYDESDFKIYILTDRGLKKQERENVYKCVVSGVYVEI